MVQTNARNCQNHDASDYMMTMMGAKFNHGHHGNQTNHGSDNKKRIKTLEENMFKMSNNKKTYSKHASCIVLGLIYCSLSILNANPTFADTTHGFYKPGSNKEINIPLSIPDAESLLLHIEGEIDRWQDYKVINSSLKEVVNVYSSREETKIDRYYHIEDTSIKVWFIRNSSTNYPGVTVSIISCPKNPIPNGYIFTNPVEFDFSGNINGLYFLVDENQKTIITPENSKYTKNDIISIEANSNLETRYLHIARANENLIPEETFHIPYKTYPKPIVESSSHPDSEDWYESTNVSIQILTGGPSDIQFRYVVDNDPYSIPDKSSNYFEPSWYHTDLILKGQKPGTNYLHIRTQNDGGDDALAPIECVTHFKFNIKSLPHPISSSTHPNQSEWYTSPDVTFFIGQWVSGMKLHYIIDDEPNTIPEKSSDETSNSKLTIKNQIPGIHYLHVRSENSEGVMATEDLTSHFRFNITPVLPQISSTTHPNQGEWYDKKNVTIKVESQIPDAPLRCVIDDIPDTIPDESSPIKVHEFVIPAQTPGTHYLHVRVENHDGKLTSPKLTSHFRFNIAENEHSIPPKLPVIKDLTITPTIVPQDGSISAQGTMSLE